MSQFNNDYKEFNKKINSGNAGTQDIKHIMSVCGDKISEFQLYSLALKYYSYLERNRDVEEDLKDIDLGFDEHVHDENCNHEHQVEHVHDENCNHDHQSEHSGVESETIREFQLTFEDFIGHIVKTGDIPSVNELLELRADLKKNILVLTAYGDQISLLENVYYKSRFTDDQMMVMDTDEGFSQRVTEQLMINENSSEIREHLKAIYPELPMRMTKGKFFSFIDEYFNRLKGIPTQDVKNHIQVIKETFAPSAVEGYGLIGEEIAKELERVQSTLIGGEQKDKDSAYHHMYHLTEDKNNVLESELDLSELLNHVLALSLVNYDTSESRVFKTIKPLLAGESEEMILADIFDDVEKNYEPLGEELMKVGNLIETLVQHQDLIESADSSFNFQELRFAFELSKEGYFIERPYNKDETVPSLKELALIKKELLGFMEEVFTNESREMRRGRMSLMMSILQVVHTTGQEIYDYIYQSISSCSNKGEKAMSMQNIYSYLNDFIEE